MQAEQTHFRKKLKQLKNFLKKKHLMPAINMKKDLLVISEKSQKIWKHLNLKTILTRFQVLIISSTTDVLNIKGVWAGKNLSGIGIFKTSDMYFTKAFHLLLGKSSLDIPLPSVTGQSFKEISFHNSLLLYVGT